MIDQEKVKLMTKLAVLEKNQTLEEKRAQNSFKSDYVYMSNWKMRFCVTIVYLLVVGMILFNKILGQQIDLLEFNYKNTAIVVVAIYFILMILSSMITTYIYSKRYDNIDKKQQRYFEQLKKLNDFSKNEE